MAENTEQLEVQKQELIDTAEAALGKEYFKKLDMLSQDLLFKEDEEQASYTLIVNYQGAFYACQE
jgi:hypothetical protein